jgi:hypothetical protein
MMPVLQGYTNDGLLMNNFGPESDCRHKHKLLPFNFLYYTRFNAYFLSCHACNSGRPDFLELEMGDLENGIKYIIKGANPSVGVCMPPCQLQRLFRVGCFGDVISMDEFRMLRWEWVWLWVWCRGGDCGPFQCIVLRFPTGVKRSNEALSHS